jgi:hypothetical protein
MYSIQKVNSVLLSYYSTLLITSHRSNNELPLQLLYFLDHKTYVSWRMPKICKFLIIWLYGRIFPKILPLKSGHIFHSSVSFYRGKNVICMYVCVCMWVWMIGVLLKYWTNFGLMLIDCIYLTHTISFFCNITLNILIILRVLLVLFMQSE